MVKKSKLLLALDAHKGRDYEKEKKLKQLKAGEKRNRQKGLAQQKTEGIGSDAENDAPQPPTGEQPNEAEDDFEAFSDAEDVKDEQPTEPTRSTQSKPNTIPRPAPDPQSASEADPDSDVPLSDLDEEDRADTILHQRLTINNGPALVASRNRVAVVKPNMPFHLHNSLISPLPPASAAIPDPNDDLTRELEFYRIAKDAALTARTLLTQAKIPFTRPADYFAEMVKTDEHMALIKRKLYEEAAAKKASSEAKALREAKKFGKRVQVAKEQERAKEKRNTLDKIKDLKRKRRGNDTGDVREDDDLFDKIEVEDASGRRERGGGAGAGRGGGDRNKRLKKDSKFGFGGKKRFSKSGDVESTADMSGFSARRMKEGSAGRGGARGGRGGGSRGGRGSTRGGRGSSRGGSGGGSKRLGKSKRNHT